ncbi:MAG: HNH endonuclease [Anaerolineae bacterium]|nr:HNH endonuclease [Anaerolineae bacterium]
MASGKTYRRGLKPAEVTISPAQFIAEGYAERIQRSECSVRLVYDLKDVRPTAKAGVYELVFAAGNTTLVDGRTRLVVDAPTKPFVRQRISPFGSTPPSPPAPPPVESSEPAAINLKQETLRVKAARRLARKRGLPATATYRDWKAAIKYFKGCCAVCQQPLNPPTLDHWIPMAQGGGTTPDNILPLCLDCNNHKHEQPGSAWLLEQYGPVRGGQMHLQILKYFDYARRRQEQLLKTKTRKDDRDEQLPQN